MFQKIAKHRANDASNDVHRPPLAGPSDVKHELKRWCIVALNCMLNLAQFAVVPCRLLRQIFFRFAPLYVRRVVGSPIEVD